MNVDGQMKTAGFYTTRVVRAESAEVAADEARAQVKGELPQYMGAEQVSQSDISISEIDELPPTTREKRIRGFSWYLAEEP